jgi:HEAT repeat protein
MKSQTRSSAPSLAFLVLVVLALVASRDRAFAADDSKPAGENPGALVRVLQSEAAPAEKAMACKKLAVYGTADAVPALAPLLSDTNLASWARIALEAIPGPAADAALRDASGKLQGRLLIGAINSIGYRRDPLAVPSLIGKLKDADVDVASAAAAALGHIGGDAAAKALAASLASAPTGVRRAIAEGCVLCAERFLAEGNATEAAKLYDQVRQADVPRQVVLESTRGAILARKSAGLPLLLEQLRSPDKARLDIGLRTARELPGRDVTEALAAEVSRSAPERQALILLAVSDRNDAAVVPAILAAARTGPSKLRIAAVGVLEHRGNAASVPVLLEAATADDAALARAAKGVLARLAGADVDADLLVRLGQATGRMRAVLLELAGQRHLAGALPVALRSAEDPDPAIRGAAVQSLGALGEARQTEDLVRLLLKTQDAKEREEQQKALVSVSGRSGPACVVNLRPLLMSGDSALRTIALHALATVGGSEALAAVQSALEDKTETVQDEAVRTLSTWPNNWPDDTAVAEPLLALARSGKKLSHQVLGLRGYLQYVQEDKKLPNDQKVARVTEVRSLLKRPEETRLAIAALGTVPTFGALELLVTFTTDAEVAEDACSAIVNLAGRNLEGTASGQPQKALQTVLQTSKNDATKKKADRILQGSK